MLFMLSELCHNRAVAEDALDVCAKRGDTPAEVERDIDLWLDYCHSPAGRSITHPGLFIAARLRSGDPPPQPTNQKPASWYSDDEASLIQR